MYRKIIFLLVLLPTSCESQPSKQPFIQKDSTYKEDNSKDEEQYLVVNKDEYKKIKYLKMYSTEKIDLENFNKHKNSDDEYSRQLSSGAVIFEERLDDGSYYSKRKESANSLLVIYKEYYPNGAIKVSGTLYEKDFAMGIWQYYDRNGNLEKAIDYDKPYKFTWEDVKQYCKENDIDLHHEHTTIQREYSSVENRGNWLIMYWQGKVPGKPFREIWLDGITGKLTKEILRGVSK